MKRRIVVGVMVLMIALASVGVGVGSGRADGNQINPINKCTPCLNV